MTGREHLPVALCVLHLASCAFAAMSFNVYRDDLVGWTPGKGIDLPVIIGEFHFGAHDRGLFGSGQRNALTQEGRAAAIRRYVGSALAHPLVVGVHWHQYSDQPTSGRFDGEHFQAGLTDICDRPYPETIQAIRAIGCKTYEMRNRAPATPVARAASRRTATGGPRSVAALFVRRTTCQGVPIMVNYRRHVWRIEQKRRRARRRLWAWWAAPTQESRRSSIGWWARR